MELLSRRASRNVVAENLAETTKCCLFGLLHFKFRFWIIYCMVLYYSFFLAAPCTHIPNKWIWMEKLSSSELFIQLNLNNGEHRLNNGGTGRATSAPKINLWIGKLCDVVWIFSVCSQCDCMDFLFLNQSQVWIWFFCCCYQSANDKINMERFVHMRTNGIRHLNWYPYRVLGT